MRKSAVLRRLIIVILGSLSCLYLCSASAVNPATGHPAAASGGALFKIQDAHHTLYLFGTIHVGAADFFPLAPRAMRALEQAPAVALEIDPANIGAMQTALQQYAYYPEGRSFRTELSSSLQQQVLAALAKYHIAEPAVARMRPWMIASLLTVQEFDSHGYHSDMSVDAYLAAFIRKQHKPVIELESAATQLALFGALSDAQQSLLLEDTLKDMDDPDSSAKTIALAQSWRNNDLPSLQKLLDDMADDHSFVERFTRQVLLDQRNPVLGERLAALLQHQDRVFAAIGILHLVGSNSVPALLQRRGLKVERIF